MSKRLSLLLLVLGLTFNFSFGQTVVGNWTVRHPKDAFGDKDYSISVYTTEINGTTNLITEGESCQLCIYVGAIAVENYNGEIEPAPRIMAFLMRGVEEQNFFNDTKVFVKLNTGQKFNVPCYVENGSVHIGITLDDFNALLDIFEQGNYTLAITSQNMFGGGLNCLFHVGSKTKGIRKLFYGK